MKVQIFLPVTFLCLTLFGTYALESFANSDIGQSKQTREDVKETDNFNLGFIAAKMGNFAEAIKLWKPLAEQGESHAQYNLGLIYEQEVGFQNFKEAFYWYKKSAIQGVLEAQYRLGFAYSVGQGVDDNPMAGLMWIIISLGGGNEKAAHLKNILVQFMNDNKPEYDAEKIAFSLALECVQNNFMGCYPEESNLEIKKA